MALSFKANNLVPDYLCKKFTSISNSPTIDTRSCKAGNLCIPKTNCDKYKQSFTYNGVKS